MTINTNESGGGSCYTPVCIERVRLDTNLIQRDGVVHGVFVLKVVRVRNGETLSKHALGSEPINDHAQVSHHSVSGSRIDSFVVVAYGQISYLTRLRAIKTHRP